MKNFRMIILIVGILVAGLAFNSVAQTAPSSEYSQVKSHDHGKHKNKGDKINKDKHKNKGHRINKDKQKNKPEKLKGKSK